MKLLIYFCFIFQAYIMLKYLFIAILLSLSPFGEAKVGLPYAMLKGVNVYLAFSLCLIANILIFPLMYFFLNSLNRYFFKWRPYKKSAVFVARRAKEGAKKGIHKYGYWGLMLFVMIPLPGSGVYAGTIVSYLFRFKKRKAFIANTIGITLSSLIVWGVTIASMGKS